MGENCGCFGCFGDSPGTLLDRCFLLAGRAYIALRRSMPLWPGRGQIDAIAIAYPMAQSQSCGVQGCTGMPQVFTTIHVQWLSYIYILYYHRWQQYLISPFYMWAIHRNRLAPNSCRTWQVGLPFEGDWPRGRGWLLMPAARCERSRGGGDCKGPREIFWVRTSTLGFSLWSFVELLSVFESVITPAVRREI